MKNYDHKKIENKWQKEWEKRKIYHAKDFSKKPKYYSLIEFPYPSGAGMHVGHIRSNTAMDIISRKRRMEGYNVLYPIGWDAFGLPTENYAIKTGIHPIKVTKDNTDTFRRQLKSVGFSFDWSREINTTDPKYYKWTQWIFLQFLKKGLAYKAKMDINWCPKDKTGLADEEVIAGCCERCGTPVEKKEKEQWMLAITKYADRLDKDLDDVDYLPQIKLGQRNWIGRSEGAEILFKIKCNPSLILPEGEGEMPGFFTTNPKLWRALQDKALEMRKNPTSGEKIMWDLLRRNNLSPTLPKGEGENSNGCHFRRQHIVDRFIVDFVCIEKKLVIEVDGDIHDYKKSEDQERTKILNQLGFEVIRFTNDEVIKKQKDVLQKIIFKLNSVSSKALSFGEGLGGVELDSVKVFTTRPDTIFGATYMVLAPEHELVQKLKSQISNWNEVERYIKKTKQKNEIDREGEGKEKTGVELKGIKAINPANKEEIPVWIADYVLMGYGTGAIMAVPAHDERDFQFAKKYDLLVREVVRGEGEFSGVKEHIVNPYIGPGFLVNSGRFNGEDNVEIQKEITKFIGGKEKTTFKLRDWIFSRQRYWGEPIPVIHCNKCALRDPSGQGIVPVPEKDLPIKLPKVKNYQPTDSGESPLANIAKWVNTKCPKCKGKARRETDTMPNWAGSSWYFLRYSDTKNTKNFASEKNLKYWTPVNWYNGGMEHTTLHLLYSRFWHKFLFDLKLTPISEPYMKRTSHGMILGEGGFKMSKSLGNVINPDDIVKTYGADTLRVYEMFMGPFNQSVVWSTESIIGSRRFIEKVWRIGQKVSKQKKNTSLTPPQPSPKEREEFKASPFGGGMEGVGGGTSLVKLLHKTIKKVSEDIESMSFNTAISSMMILATEIERAQWVSIKDFKIFLQILSPFAPHIAEELWNKLGEKKSINLSDWPKVDENLIQDKEIKIVIQISGKVRTEMMIQIDEKEEDIKNKALKNEVVLRHILDKDIKKVFYVKNRLINIVV